MAIEAVVIVGASSTGTSLAEIFLLNGFQVRLYDNFKDSLNISMAKIKWFLEKNNKTELLSNIEAIQDYNKFNGADIIIETVNKSIEERTVFFNKIIKEITEECLIATYTNLITLKQIFDNIPALSIERTIGINFIKPIKTNKIVEIIKTDKTSDEIIEKVESMIVKIQKNPIIVKDNPGQIIERIARVYALATFNLLNAGKGCPNEIDSAFKKISGAEYGPFEYLDYIGLDHDYSSGTFIWESLNKPERLKPSDLELRLIQYGQLGRKSTIGIYIYENGKIVGENPSLNNIVKYLGLRKTEPETIFAEIMRPVIEECKILASEIMVSEYDIEKSLKAAFMWPKGPFAYYREFSNILEKKVSNEFDQLDSF